MRQPFLISLLDLFLDLSALTDSVSEVVELCASDFTASHNVDLCDVGRVKREGLLNTAAVSYAANCEGLRDAAAVLADDGSFEHLDSFSSTLFDKVVNSDCVTDIERGDLSLQLLADKSVDLSIHFDSSLCS